MLIWGWFTVRTRGIMIYLADLLVQCATRTLHLTHYTVSYETVRGCKPHFKL